MRYLDPRREAERVREVARELRHNAGIIRQTTRLRVEISRPERGAKPAARLSTTDASHADDN
jgi:hypothetical protein